MISTFKSLDTGVKRAITVTGFFFPLIAGAITGGSEEFVPFALIVYFPLYCTLVFAGLWVYEGFDRDKSRANTETRSKNKNNLIRHLVKRRVQENDTLTMSESEIDSLEGLKLAGMPESTIVSIVELYCALKGTGAQENEILQYIETAREGVRQSIGEMPSNLTLNSYINYRLKIEHNNTSGLTDKFISYAIKASLNHFES